MVSFYIAPFYDKFAARGIHPTRIKYQQILEYDFFYVRKHCKY